MSESASQNDLDALIKKETEAMQEFSAGPANMPLDSSVSASPEVIRNQPEKSIRYIQPPSVKKQPKASESLIEDLLQKPYGKDPNKKSAVQSVEQTQNKHLDDLEILINKETHSAESSTQPQHKSMRPSPPEREETLNRILHPVDTIDEKRKQIEDRMRHMTLHQQRRDYKRRMVAVKRAGFLSKLILLPLVIFAMVFLLQQPFWKITNLNDSKILNTQVLTFKNLKPLLEQQVLNHPLYWVQPKKLETSIKQHFPIVDDVQIRRYLFPARLEFTVTEKPIYGELYKTSFNPTGKEAPYALLGYNHEVVPLALYKYQPGKTLPRSQVSRINVHPDIQLTPQFLTTFRKLVYQLNHLNGFTLQAISLYPSPKVKDNAMIEVEFSEGKVLLGKMDAEIFIRLERLLPLRETLIKNHDKLRWVDLRWGEQVSLRKK